MAPYLGDFAEDEVVHFLWATNGADGASITRSTNGTVSVYKDNGTTQSTAGVTDTEDFDGLTGIHACTIDTSADAFYAAGANYTVVLSGATVDTKTVNAVLAHFSIQNRVVASVTGAVGSVTGNVGGNVTGSVGSVTGAVGSVTGAVGSVTGNVGGNVTGSIGSLAAQAKADVNAEVDTAIADARLDELLAADSDIDGAAPPTVGSVFHELMSKTTGSFTFDQTTDSLEAVRDRGDAAWVTATGFSTLDAAGVRSAVGLASANLDTQIGTLATASALGTVDTVVDAIKVTTDKLDDTLEDDAGTYRFTTNALEQAPSGGASAADIADAVWDEALAGHAGAGSAGEALAAAGTAGDPWTTALPGSYSSGQAGYIIGTNLNATVSSRLASASYTAPLDAAGTRSAVGLASANLDTQLAAIDDAVDTEVAAILAAVDTEVAAIKAKTDNLPASPAATSDIPAASAIADAVWDEARADHTTNGTFGQGAASVQGNVTGSVGSVTGAVGSVTGNVGGNVAGSVGSVTGNVGGNVTGSVGSLAAQAKADVNAEADAAIETYHLDHLLAATYDPASKPGAADALLNELVENDGGVARYTANALEQAPSGSGASAADIADAVWDEPIADHIAAGTTANALNSATAAGNPWEAVIEGSLTAEDILRVLAGVAAGKTVIVKGSGGTATVTFRDITDSGDIVEAQMVGSERQSVTVTP